MNLPVEVREIATAIIESKPIKQLHLPDLMDKLTDLIHKTHVSCGFAVKEEKEEIVIYQTQTLATDLAMEYGGLTFKEIEIAFKRGWKGVYGDFMGLSNKTYFKWVKSYCEEESRLRAKKEIQNAQNILLHEDKILTPEQKDNRIREGIVINFDQFKLNPNCIVPSAWYDYLWRKGLIDYSEDLRNKFKETAREQLMHEKLQEHPNSNAKKMITEYILALDNQNNPDLVNRGKSLAVKHWFEFIIAMDDNIVEVLKDAKSERPS